MKPEDIVVSTKPVNGIEINSVGIINSVDQEEAMVYFVGKNKVVIAPFDSLSVIDADKTGKGYSKKICNVCHILKPIEEFSRNQNDGKGRPTRRPSCKDCRKIIEGKDLTGEELKRMIEKQPPDRTIFECPICEKQTIVSVTVTVRKDHDHETGKGREWICDSCNTGLGRFKDNIEILERAIDYLKSFE